MSYCMGVDAGGTRTVAAVCRPDRGPVLAADLPSVVFAAADGALLVGEEAERRAPSDPGRVARRFTRRVGDGTPLLVGDAAVAAEILVARLVAGAVATAGVRERGTASRVAVTHPAGWGEFRITALRSALAANGFGGALLLPDAQAAALAQDARERLAPGAVVAVYDLGGSACRATVLRKLDDRFVQLGRTEEVEVGGVDFDEAVFAHVRSALGPKWTELDLADPAVLAAVPRLRAECVRAKEILSADTAVLVPVALPGVDTEVRLARAELEEMIRPAVEETVAALERAIGSARLAPGEPILVVLTGGSALIPLVTQVVSARLGWPVSVGPDPKGMVADGAALAARGTDAGPTRIVARPAVPAQRPAPPRSGPTPPAGPPPSTVERPGLFGRLSKTATIAVAVGAIAVAAVSVTMWVTMNQLRPAGADVDTVTGNTATTTEVVPTTTSAQVRQRQQPATTPQRQRTTMPSGSRPPSGMPATTTMPPRTTETTTTGMPATTSMPPMSTAATTTAGQP